MREGVTNVAKDARATRCTVILTASEVEIRDDGVEARPATDTASLGSGSGSQPPGAVSTAGPLARRGWCLRVSLDPAGGGRA